MANLYLGRSNQNLAQTGTVSATVAFHTNYPLTNVYDGRADLPGLTNSASPGAFGIDINSGSAVDAQIAAIVMHNVPAGSDVRLQRGAAQGGTTMNAPFTIAAYGADGLPRVAWLDLTTVGGYGSFQWTRFSFPALAQRVGVTEILLYSTGHRIHNFSPGLTLPRFHPATVHRTRTGGRIGAYEEGTTRRGVAGELRLDAASYTKMVDAYEAAQGAYKGFFVALEAASVDEAWFLEWANDPGAFVPARTYAEYRPQTVTWWELPRGAAIPTT